MPRPNARRIGGALLGAAALSIPAYGCFRAFIVGLTADDADSSGHTFLGTSNDSFIQALRMGTASEADDASC